MNLTARLQAGHQMGQFRTHRLTTSCKLTIDLLFEDQHIPVGQVLEQI